MHKSLWILLGLIFLISGIGFWTNKLKITGIHRSIQGRDSILIDLWLDKVPSTNNHLFKNGAKTNLLVRNRPHGKLEIISSYCEPLSTELYYLHRANIPGIKPQGKVFQKPYLWQCRLTLHEPHALKTANGYVSGGNQFKIGSYIALEAPLYRVDGYIVNIRHSNIT